MSVPSPYIKQRQVILVVRALEAGATENVLGAPRYVVEVQEAHVVDAALFEKYILRCQIRVHNIFLVEQANQVNYFDGDLDGLVFRKQSPLGVIVVQVLH